MIDSKIPENHILFANSLQQFVDNGLISRERFKPSLLPRHLLPWISKWRPVSSAAHVTDLSCLLFGSNLVEFFGQEMTGKYLNDWKSETRARYLLESSQIGLDQKKPVYTCSQVRFPAGRCVNTTNALYPVRRRDGYSLLLLTQIVSPSFHMSDIPRDDFPIDAVNKRWILEGVGQWDRAYLTDNSPCDLVPVPS